MELKDYWKQLPDWAKWVAATLPTLGLLGAFVGIFVLDETEWWDPKGFGVNVATSFVGALVGIPLAVVVIGWFTSEHLDRLQIPAITEVTEEAWMAFREAVLRAASESIYMSLYDDAQEVDRKAQTLIERLEHHQRANGISSSDIYDPVVEIPESDDYFIAESELRDLTRELQEATKAVRFSIGEREDWHREWVAARLRWVFISTEVRRQRYSQRLSWMLPENEVNLETLVYEGSPVQAASLILSHYEEFAEILDNNLVLGLGDALSPKDHYRAVASIKVSPLRDSCGSACQRMADLRWAIDEADKDPWRSPVKVR